MNTITLKDTNGNPIAQYPLNGAGEQHIEAINGAYYQIDGLPDIRTARDGDNLLISLDGDSRPELVIEHPWRRRAGRHPGGRQPLPLPGRRRPRTRPCRDPRR